MKVKCIDAAGGDAYMNLVVGDVYEVEHVAGLAKDHYALKGIRPIYKQSRFEIVEGSIADLPKISAEAAPFKILSLECPCGILRSQCTYHMV